MAGSGIKWMLPALLLGQSAASTTPSPTVPLPWSCDFEEMLTDDALGGYHGHASSQSDLNQGIQVRGGVETRCLPSNSLRHPAVGLDELTQFSAGICRPRDP